MPTTINASASSGLITTADTSTILQLQTGGTAAVTVDASQNVGIGTASPDTSLAVRSTGANGINLGESLNNSVVSSRLFFSNATAGQSAAIYNSSGGLLFTTGATLGSGSGTERMRVLSTGNILSLSGGSTSATGTGIAFPAVFNASSDANTLDDYEEGTFTPTLTGVGGTAITYSAGASDAGYYTKVGNTVTVGITLNGTYTGGPPASFRVGQLPFVASSSANLVPTALIMNNSTGNAISSTGGWVEGTLSSIRVFGTWTSGQKYFVSCTYFV